MDEIVHKIAEECSKGSGSVNEFSLRHLRPYIESFLDPDWLDANINKYKTWAKEYSDPALQRVLLHHPIGMNILVAMIWAARSWEEEYLLDPSFRPQNGAKSLIGISCSLAILELHSGNYLDSRALKYIQTRLQSTNNFWGMAHEINTFAYFIRNGADVEPKFLNPANREEIVVHWREHSIPVQCKSKQRGAGRLIPQDSFVTLAGSIAHDAKVARRKLLVQISSTGPVRQQDIDFLRNRISSMGYTNTGPVLVSNEARTFALTIKPISGNITFDSARSYLSNFNFHVGILIGDPSPNGTSFNVDAVVGIDAHPEDNLRSWNSLRQSINRGAKQLIDSVPGIVAIHYADPVLDFEDLGPSSQPMKAEMAKIMDRYPHLVAIMLSSEPDLQIPTEKIGGEARSYVKETCKFAELLGSRI